MTGRTTPVVTDEQITWMCAHCPWPILDRQGYLAVDPHETVEVRASAAEVRQRREGATDLFGIFDYPEPVRWTAMHAACDPDPEGPAYWIEIDHVRTYRGLLAATARLMVKTWFRFTDWDELLERVAVQPEPAERREAHR